MRVLQKLIEIEQISNFPIHLTNSQLNCLIFAKKQRNLSKIIILPSCAEELGTAKQGNDLKLFNNWSFQTTFNVEDVIFNVRSDFRKYFKQNLLRLSFCR